MEPPRWMKSLRAKVPDVVVWAVMGLVTTIVAAIVVYAVTFLALALLLKPHAPYMDVQAASLANFRYDQVSIKQVQVALLVQVHNDNEHSSATFTGLECRVRFAGDVLAILRADPLDVPARGTVSLPFVANARDAPLSDAGQTTLQAALRQGVIPFELDGEVTARYHFVTPLLPFHKTTSINCGISFVYPNGTALPFNCAPKKYPLF